MSILSIKNFSISAWGTTLIHDLNLSLNAGEILAIIGPNGAGKTTLMNTFVNAGLANQRVTGELKIFEKNYQDYLPDKRAKQIALLPQSSTLSFPFTVEEVIQLGRIPHSTGKAIDDEIIGQTLKELDISHLRSRLYTQLSGGEKQRVQLARVMAQIWREEDCYEPTDNNAKTTQRLLLLDEPSSSLDLGHQQQLMNIIRRFAGQGVAVVIVAHDINLVIRHADKVLALNVGATLAHGAPAEVVTAELMKKLYHIDVDVIQHPSTGKLIVTPC